MLVPLELLVLCRLEVFSAAMRAIALSAASEGADYYPTDEKKATRRRLDF